MLIVITFVGSNYTCLGILLWSWLAEHQKNSAAKHAQELLNFKRRTEAAQTCKQPNSLNVMYVKRIIKTNAAWWDIIWLSIVNNFCMQDCIQNYCTVLDLTICDFVLICKFITSDSCEDSLLLVCHWSSIHC